MLDLKVQGATLADGLGLWRGVIVDQHFLRRQRFNRLLTVVLENPALVGVGIDEQTAVIVQGEKCEVLGESGVTLIDAREAANTATRESAARDADRSTNETDKIPLSARGVRLDLIRAGETFVVARRAGAKREADQP